MCEWLRGQEEGGKCARAVEEGALSLRALLSPPEVHLFLPLFSPQIPLSLSSPLRHPSSRRSSHQTRTSTLENIYRIYSRAAFSPPLSSLPRLRINPSLSLALLRLLRPSSPSRHGYRAHSLCLFPLFFPPAAPLSTRLCPFHVSRQGGGGGGSGEEKVGKKEEDEQWD